MVRERTQLNSNLQLKKSGNKKPTVINSEENVERTTDNEKKKTLQNEMITQIQKHIVPIRRDINNKRKRNTKNKCSMSYKKSF